MVVQCCIVTMLGLNWGAFLSSSLRSSSMQQWEMSQKFEFWQPNEYLEISKIITFLGKTSYSQSAPLEIFFSFSDNVTPYHVTKSSFADYCQLFRKNWSVFVIFQVCRTSPTKNIFLTTNLTECLTSLCAQPFWMSN